MLGARRVMVAFLLIVAVVVGAQSVALADNTIDGTFALKTEVGGKKARCFGTNGYEDIQPGARVVVRNGSGKVLARGALDHGTGIGSSDGHPLLCVYKFTVDDVPDSTAYTIEVGNRGEVPFSKKKLDRRQWIVALAVGG